MAGSTNSIFYLSDGLARRGHQVVVACPERSLLYQMLEGTPVIRVPLEIRSKFDIRSMRQLRDVIRDYQIQIVNAQSSRDRYISILAKFFFRMTVLVYHTRRQTPRSSGNFLQNWFYARFTDRIIAVSPGVKKAMVTLGLPEHHIQVIFNGTPPEKYQISGIEARLRDLRAHYHIQPEEPVIGCVSRPKQQEQLIQAMAKITKRCTVMFVGMGNRPEYERLIAGQIHRYIFTGAVSSSDVLYYYPLFRMKVLASVTEGLSQALLEAMALGVPVIATDAAGNPDLIEHGKNGLLFADGDIDMLASHIIALLDDSRLGKALSVAARKRALEDFSIQKTVENYEKFFMERLRLAEC